MAGQIDARDYASDRSNNIPLGTKNTLGPTTEIYMPNCLDTIIQYVVANIGTNVVVRPEGSNDNVNWFNLDTGDTTITANGTYAFHYPYRVNYIRLNFVSRNGGTPTITISVSIGVIS